MDKKLKARWIKALRSGRYEQTTGVMESFGSYCCLGVLRKIMHPTSKKTAPSEDILCPSHAIEAGLHVRSQRKLTELNDEGKTFPEIAAFIEKHY